MSKTWDTEKIENFIESFVGAYDRYTDDLRSFEDGMAKYYYNDTYRGQAAEASKNFIDAGQNKLHMKQIDVQRRLVSMYYHMLNEFKDKVDSSPKARIDTDILLYIKKHFKGCDRVVDVAGYDIECKARYIADKFRRINGSLTPPSYRMLGEMYEDLDGSGGLIDHCIRKFEEFDEEMYSEINQSGIEDDVDELHGQIVTTASILDAIHVQVEEVLKKKVGVDTKRINHINPFAVFKSSKLPKYLNVYGMQIQLYDGKSDDDHIYVDDSKRVRIGTVNDTFITVTGVPGKKDPVYGGNQAWLKDFPENGKRFSDMGCGVIASVNQYLYLTGQTTISYEDYKKIAYGFLNAEDQPVSRRGTHSEVRKQAIKGPISGALPNQMSTYITSMCEDKGVTVSSNWDYIKDYEADYQNMKKQLNEGVPVIWAVNDFGEESIPFHEYDSKNGVYVHDPHNAVEKERKGGGASSHYVVATGLYEEFDDNGDKRRMVEISSWGNKYYVDYDQYIDVVSQNPLNQPFSSVMNTKIK
ncbi:T7SS effector LXG polymorphic toxin [Butyrivibrio sp. AE2005]|uniref:T7SS effector LXG polymorphic toxin n=1 Tax=Butyrivibrio sp. AE2005 TaxID=1496722 RepID=UPI000479145C|nr:T7SS effector LXG polymorphic toxin [Butyrivibrio sp. AE2005]